MPTRRLTRRLSRPAAAGLKLSLIALAAVAAAGCDEDFASPTHIRPEGQQVVVVSGDSQVGFVNAPLPDPLRVRVLDSRGKPAPQQRVDFQMLEGEGLLNGRPLSATAVTDFSGFTQVRFTPREEREFVVQAWQPDGGAEARVNFTLEAKRFDPRTNPANFEKVEGDSQVGAVGAILPLPLTVRVANKFGDPLENIPVLFTATTDGTLLLTANEGDFTQTDTLGAAATDSIGRQVVSFSDTNGVAAVLVRLRIRPGDNRVTASTTFVTGSNNDVVFNATGTIGGAGSADSLAKVSGDQQVVRVDTTKTGGVVPPQTFNPMVVQVTDRFGNPIAGVRVLFRVSTGGGSVSLPQPVTTDTTGFAQTFYSSPQGVSGGFAVSASAPALGKTVIFTGQIIAEGTTAAPSGGGGGGGGGAPTLNSLFPDNKPAGGPGFFLTVNGSNFAPTAKVLWNGAERTTTFLNGGELQANIPANDIATAGTAQVTVVNVLGGTSSNALTFTIN